MGLIEDLMTNRYLITPSAYYLLADGYKRDFTLAELIKFAKARGTFVIDSSIAREFLEMKGGVPLEVPSPSESQQFAETGEGILEDSGGVVEYREEQSHSVDSAGDSASLSEISDVGEDSADRSGTLISTGNAEEVLPKTPSFSQLEQEKPHFFGGESPISTGTSVSETSSDESGEGVAEVSGEVLPVEDVRTENSSTESDVLLEDNPLENSSQGPLVAENEYANGSDYGDSEEYYENGNGVKPKIVYGDYGVPIAYVGDEVLEEEKSYSVYRDVVITPREGFVYRAREIPDDWELVFDVKDVKFEVPKVKSAASKEGEIIVKVYADYFKSRLRKMRRILRENPELGSVIDIGKLSYVGGDEEVTIIGLINSKKETAKGFMFEVEDNTGIIKVFINRNNEESRKFFQIMPDSVVAFRGRYSRRGLFFADKIFLPDVPKFKREKPPLEEKVYAILLSDIHVGSNKFCEKAFERFLEWLNGEVNNRKEEELVSRIKYMIIAGDVVDGIGIYPGQYNELAIPDIFDQYEALTNLLRNVPDHITTFIGPGNHDAARTALPQPGFYDEYARPLKRLKNAVIISNPAVIRLHGRDFLIAHGRGIEDVVTALPNRSHHRPAEAMLDLLKLRHLAPTFGEKVPIAPDPEDTLVIESVPDLFQAGHVHVMEYRIYNGVFLINTGTWQAQTEFQKMVNIVPTPARVPIIDVETARLRAVVRFDQFCEGV
ncbi:DNA-directed DNA polymerase II small subunit [Thermococcus sp. MV11]|uniref:DNA-directed DNA polymerase II small subunit n=1 Tax=Thermococcus sp. MV11 TaxID=1638267 RepID=UPI0014309654|nr:DNA-directed DNA polymerase II small subunit [Thermococcus sp. MV11]NJE04258.1 DNA-directed DNA polymerase II small subunit [Thermococcus sp. MV11]